MAKDFFLERRPHNGMTYAEFSGQLEKYLNETDPATLDESALVKYQYRRLNYQRSLRVSKTYQPSAEIVHLMSRISEPQLWMVLTEDWCGDSAQTLPQIAEIAKLSDKVTLRILPRDQNPDIMDHYLTDGKRGIPRLVAFDADGEELFQWGPRPREIATIFNEGLAGGKSKTELMPVLHGWYARNRGKAVENEFVSLLENFLVASALV